MENPAPQGFWTIRPVHATQPGFSSEARVIFSQQPDDSRFRSATNVVPLFSLSRISNFVPSSVSSFLPTNPGDVSVFQPEVPIQPIVFSGPVALPTQQYGVTAPAYPSSYGVSDPNISVAYHLPPQQTAASPMTQNVQSYVVNPSNDRQNFAAPNRMSGVPFGYCLNDRFPKTPIVVNPKYTQSSLARSDLRDQVSAVPNGAIFQAPSPELVWISNRYDSGPYFTMLPHLDSMNNQMQTASSNFSQLNPNPYDVGHEHAPSAAALSPSKDFASTSTLFFPQDGPDVRVFNSPTEDSFVLRKSETIPSGHVEPHQDTNNHSPAKVNWAIADTTFPYSFKDNLSLSTW